MYYFALKISDFEIPLPEYRLYDCITDFALFEFYRSQQLVQITW